MYTNEIGGYYDPKKKIYYMAAWLPANYQNMVSIHELTHALQDQKFGLRRLIDHKSMKTDSLSARSALIEGDATAVMIDFSRVLAGFPLLAKDLDLSRGFNLEDLSAVNFSTDSPESLKTMLTFPYFYGIKFVHALLQKGSYEEVNQAFLNPPKTTREIIHPADYLAKKKFLEITEVDLKKVFKLELLEYSDILGELGLKALMQMFNQEKSEIIAEGWIGDRIGLSKKDIYWLIAFETSKDLTEFISSYFIAYSEKKDCEIKEQEVICSDYLLSYQTSANNLEIIYKARDS
jgi:hypothetical protein